jgi:hypothetical protein
MTDDHVRQLGWPSTSEALMTDPTTPEGAAYWQDRREFEEWAEARAALAASLTDRSTSEDADLQDSWEAADERAADRWRGPESDR